MLRVFVFAVLMVASALLPIEMLSGAAQSGQETIYRLPKTGAPALTVPSPPGWTPDYDEFGNLLLYAPDKSAALQLSMPSGAGIGLAAPSDLAALILKGAGAPPYDRTEPDSIDGEAGQAFISAIPEKAVTVDIRVAIVKVDNDHVAVVAKLIRRDATSAQAADLNKLATRVTISR